ncbi:TIGR03084 family metal-binding protein [Sporichthya brevicatena]|uniref:TIGR03084 family metal-binding protein n=1 Tax=Sporichthya brevicatena TaxID=171442 RepID=A0ABN1H759_9ACTN
MEQITTDLAAQHAELRAVLGGLRADQWDAPSRCAGWSVADVVLHLAQSDEVAVGSARGDIDGAARAAGWDLDALHAGEQSMDALADRAVQAQRGASPADLLARWSDTADALVTTLAGLDPKEALPWVVGRLPARTLATTRLAECWIHTGDITPAAGVEQPFSERMWHIARLAWRTIPYAFSQAGQALVGPVAVVLTTPEGGTWTFSDGDPVTTVTGDAMTFCQVAARRIPGDESGLIATGPDAAAVLDLVRTFA